VGDQAELGQEVRNAVLRNGQADAVGLEFIFPYQEPISQFLNLQLQRRRCSR
jgi:hypothetical protein